MLNAGKIGKLSGQVGGQIANQIDGGGFISYTLLLAGDLTSRRPFTQNLLLNE
jgi:hypothetical protein